MTNLRITFVITKPESRHALHFAEDVAGIDAQSYVPRLEVTPLEKGGFCFITEKEKIWNAEKNAIYDPSRVVCDFDNLGMAALFLETVVDQLEVSERFRWLLTDVVEIEITPVVRQKVFLTGRDVQGRILYHTIEVSALLFYNQIRIAALAFIQFMMRLSSRSSDFPIIHKHLEKVDARRWVRAVDRLGQLISDRFPGEVSSKSD